MPRRRGTLIRAPVASPRVAAWHANLARGESLLPGAAEALDACFAEPDVEAVLLPLVPVGDHALARAARDYLRAWDARFVHRQNFFAPASRAVTRAPLAGWRNADAATTLAASIGTGQRVEALPEWGVSSPIAQDLGTWVSTFRDEGHAWGALAARDPRFAPFLPALTRRAWWRHNVAQLPRRTIEVLEAVRAPRPLLWGLHELREAAWTRGCVEGHHGARRR